MCRVFFRLAGLAHVWNVRLNMKTPALVSGLAILALASSLHAQSARQLTRKIVPPPSPQPPAGQSAAPAKPAPPTPPATPGSPSTAVPAPPPPADAEKARQETIRKTVEFQKKRAEDGSAAAQYDLGLRYLKGDGVEKDEKTGRKWIETSATNGYSLAIKKLEELTPPKK
jgi:type IV secretory pathway VirB10-like protein